jgi:type IV pilus assembly protein PilO
MPELGQTRHKLKLAAAALVAVALLAVAVLLSPLVGSVESRRAELNLLWQDLQAKTRQVEPLRGLDQKIPVAGQQIQQFYKERIPAHESEVAVALGKVAQENGVKLLGVKYKADEAGVVDLQPLEIELNVEGNYPQLARFLNALERDKLFFIVNSVELEEQQGPVKLAMKLETYLRTGA